VRFWTFRGPSFPAAVLRRRTSTTPDPPVSLTSDDSPPPDEDSAVADVRIDPEERRLTQALAQQQQVFLWRLRKDRSLFKLHLAMGWATFVLLPASAAAAFAVPRAVPYLVTLTGVAAWNWRRALQRDEGNIEPITNDTP